MWILWKWDPCRGSYITWVYPQRGPGAFLSPMASVVPSAIPCQWDILCYRETKVTGTCDWEWNLLEP